MPLLSFSGEQGASPDASAATRVEARLGQATLSQHDPSSPKHRPALRNIRTHAPSPTRHRTAYATTHMDHYSPINNLFTVADASENGYSPIAMLCLGNSVIKSTPMPCLVSKTPAAQAADSPTAFATENRGYSPISHINCVDASEAGYSPIASCHLPSHTVVLAASDGSDDLVSSGDLIAVADYPSAAELPMSCPRGPGRPSHFEAALNEMASNRALARVQEDGEAEAGYSPIARICEDRKCSGVCAAPDTCVACRAWRATQARRASLSAVEAGHAADVAKPSQPYPVAVSTQQRAAPCGRAEQRGPLDLGLLLKTPAGEMWVQTRGCMRVCEVKQKVWELTGVPVARQILRLEAEAAPLNDEYAMYDYGVQNGCTVTMAMR